MIDYIIKHTRDYHNTALINLINLISFAWNIQLLMSGTLLKVIDCMLNVLPINRSYNLPWLLRMHRQNPIIISLLILSHLTCKVGRLYKLGWEFFSCNYELKSHRYRLECLMSTWDFWYLEMTNIRYLTRFWSNIVMCWSDIYTFKCGCYL